MKKEFWEKGYSYLDDVEELDYFERMERLKEEEEEREEWLVTWSAEPGDLNYDEFDSMMGVEEYIKQRRDELTRDEIRALKEEYGIVDDDDDDYDDDEDDDDDDYDDKSYDDDDDDEDDDDDDYDDDDDDDDDEDDIDIRLGSNRFVTSDSNLNYAKSQPSTQSNLNPAPKPNARSADKEDKLLCGVYIGIIVVSLLAFAIVDFMLLIKTAISITLYYIIYLGIRKFIKFIS